MTGETPGMRITAVAGNYRRGLPGWAALASTVTLAAVAAGLAAGGPPVQAAVRHRPHALTPDMTSSARELTSVSAVSPTDVWAAGVYHNGRGAAEPLVLHWNGQTWATVKAPVFSGRVGLGPVVSLSAVSPTDAWVAGSYGGHVSLPLILHLQRHGLPAGPQFHPQG
jgi:hypothetical protein